MTRSWQVPHGKMTLASPAHQDVQAARYEPKNSTKRESASIRFHLSRDATRGFSARRGSSLEGREHHPVVHVAFEDAAAYAAWAGRSLPTEAQFEHAAQTSARRSSSGEHTANTWQGVFPLRNDAADGYAEASPVACYEPNALGLYDLVGNVWEWTASAYYPRHDFAAKSEHPDGYDPNQPDEPVAVLKGGSYLCAPDYCMRYRPQARIGQSRGLGASHIGFRTVLDH